MKKTIKVDHSLCEGLIYSKLFNEKGSFRKITCPKHGVYWVEEDYRRIDGPMEDIS